MNQDSVVCTVTRLLTGEQRNCGFVSWQGQEIYLLQVVQTGSGVYSALHSMCTRGSCDKVAGA